MSFTENRFTEIVEILQALKPIPRRNDKRRAVRVEIRLPADIRTGVTVQSPWRKAELRDLSSRGVCLITNEALVEGACFLIRLPSMTGHKITPPIVCRVAHAAPQADGTYMLGCEFTGRLNESQPLTSAMHDRDRIQKSILGE